MADSFPATPPSTSYATLTPSTRCAIYYGPSPSPSFTLSKSGSATYQVRNWAGTVVISGSVSGTTCAPATPTGGWLYGWYRLYLFDGSGLSSGACNFCVIRVNANFVTNPAPSVNGGLNDGVGLDEVTRGVFALGPQRYAQANAASPATSIGEIQTCTAIDAAYSDNDPFRPQHLLCAFPNGTSGDASGITTTVSDLYPLGVTWYEGPSNEPTLTAATAATIASEMEYFYAAVKAGNAGAKVLGPCIVTADLSATQPGGGIDTFLGLVAANPGAICDGFSFHAYNMLLGDLAMMRANLAALTALMVKHGLTNMPIWQTEQGVFTPVYAVYHPRRSRWSMLQLLVQESFGIPKEQNHLWYDISHGFWSQPTWWENANVGGTWGGLNPQAVLLRTFSEEVYSKPFSANISFGTYGDKMYFGGLWANPSDGTSVAIFMSPSPISGGQVTLTVTGTTSPLTLVDAWGNSSTVTPSSGRVTIPVTDTPIYLQLPNGVTVAPYSFGSWPPLSELLPSVSTNYVQTSPVGVADGIWQNGYDGNPVVPTAPYQSVAPDTATQINFRDPQRFDRVVIWCGMVWQASGTLTEFEIQTSPDGVTWTTQATVTDPPPTTISFVTGSDDVGCSLETYWPEPWIFDVSFVGGPVTAQYLRLNTTSASYGGEPDAACVAAGGQGDGVMNYAIEEISVFCDDQVLNPVIAAHL